MSAALKIKGDLSAEALRRAARRERDGRAAARMYAIANVLDGLSRAEAARLAGMDARRCATRWCATTPKASPGCTTGRGVGRRVKEGRVWVYVRDDRPWAGSNPPAAAYWFSPGHRGEHPREHLADFNGILQADACTGFRELYEPGPDGVARVREAACWAHLRRDFHDVWKATDSPIAREALERIGALYDVEAAINGQPRDVRHAVRQRRSRPKVEAFRLWCGRQLTLIPGRGDLARAMRYALNRWASFTLFLDDGRVAIDNNAAERAIKPIVLGRRELSLRRLRRRRRMTVTARVSMRP